jgi:hypothetical protein
MGERDGKKEVENSKYGMERFLKNSGHGRECLSGNLLTRKGIPGRPLEVAGRKERYSIGGFGKKEKSISNFCDRLYDCLYDRLHLWRFVRSIICIRF